MLLVAGELGEETIASRSLQEFLNGPDVICDSGLHGRGDSERLMYAAEVEKGHVQVNGGFQVLQRFAEAQTKSRKAPKVCPDGQIGPLDVAGRDSFDLRTPADLDWYSVQNLCRRVPVRPFPMRLTVNLDELCVIHFRTKAILNGGDVGLESVCGDLETASDSLAQIAGKNEGALGIPFANVVGQDQLSFAVNRHPDIGVAPLLRIVGGKMARFGVDKGPQLISLHKSRTNSAYSTVKQAAALFADSQKQGKNRALVCASEARHSTDTHSFHKQSDYLRCFFGLDVVASEWLLTGFSESSFAGFAAKSLNPQFTVGSKSLCCAVLTSDAGHRTFPLVFLREKPDNQILG